MIKNTNKDEITNRNVVFAEVSQIIDDPRRWALDDFFIFAHRAKGIFWEAPGVFLRQLDTLGFYRLFIGFYRFYRLLICFIRFNKFK